MRPNGAINFYEDSKEILPGITVVRCGGHFSGSAVLHWQNGVSGKGALLAGDTIMVAMDRKSVSFMYSYPNLIPLSGEKIRKIINRVEPLQSNRLYSAWWDRQIDKNTSKIVSTSAERYIQVISKG